MLRGLRIGTPTFESRFPPLTASVTLGKFCDLSEPCFLACVLQESANYCVTGLSKLAPMGQIWLATCFDLTCKVIFKNIFKY